MKVDASFLQIPLTAAQDKPVPRQTEHVSTRPVDRPQQDEPANNRQPDTRDESHREDTQRSSGFTANASQPASVGDLLDVIA